MPTKPLLDQSAIDTGSPEDTAYKAWQAILIALNPVPTEHCDQTIRDFPPAWRAAYTTFWLECEVNNGGHHQFFWNTEGTFNSETLEDLKLIGATPFVRIFTEARQVYDAHDYADEKSSSGNSWEGFTFAYREKRMEYLDDQFYKESKQIAVFLGEYIRAHPELFTQ